MRNILVSLTAVTIMTGGLLLGAPQESQTAPPAEQQNQARPRVSRVARMARYLNLTPAQRIQARDEFRAMRQSAQPVRQQLREVRQNMFQAVRANDSAAIDQLSAQEARLRGQLSAMHHQAFARIYSTLSPEQKAKADQLPARFHRMRQRMMQGGQAPNNG